MIAQVGQIVYFIKGFHDIPNETNLIKNEGTFYFQQNYPKDRENEIIKGKVTARREDISIPYYNMFLTFSKMDMWGSNTPPNRRNEDNQQSIVYTAKADSRGKLAFKTNEEALKIYLTLQDRGIYATLSGNVIENIDRPTRAKIIIEEMHSENKEIDIDKQLKENGFLNDSKYERLSNEKIIL